MSKTKIIGIIAVVVVLLLICIPFGMNKINNNKDSHNATAQSSQNKDSETNSKGNNDKESKGDTNSEDSTNKDEKNNSSESADKEGNSSNTDDSQNTGDFQSGSNNSGNNGGSSSENNSTTNNSSNSSSGSSAGTSEKVSSNYKTPDSDLTIQRINGYSGMFIEDGSDKEVKNVAAIQVKNNSNKAIEYGEIELYNGNKKLTFKISSLPANSSAVVMENDKKTLSGNNVTYGKTTVAYTNKLEKDSKISYSVVKNNGIELKNKSNKDIKTVRVFYKYKAKEGYYIGGITYVAKVENLKAGKSETIYPSHFASDGGQVMMIKTYND